MNIIWFLLISISIVFSIINNRLSEFTEALFEGAKSAVELFLVLVGIISLWLGVTKIVEDSGLLKKLTNFFGIFILKLFSNIPKEHPSITYITLNIVANFLGLGNAATPIGLKAMKDLQEINKEKDTVSFEMMLFLVINTASIQLIPFTTVGLLSQYGSKSPTWIVLPTILSTFISLITAVTVLFIFRKIFEKT